MRNVENEHVKNDNATNERGRLSSDSLTPYTKKNIQTINNIIYI